MIIEATKYLLSTIIFTLSCIGIYNTTTEDLEKYEAYLKIPSLALERPLYNRQDVRSDIDKELIFIEASDTPLKKKGNVIIAGHSGSSTVSYFKNLHKLTEGDYIYLEYHGIIYKYCVTKKYYIMKTGKAEIRRDDTVNTLTLITCLDDDRQLIVIANIVDKIKK